MHIKRLRIKELAAAKDMTKADVAREIGVTANYVSKWDLGQGLPSLENFADLIQVLDCDWDELVIEDHKKELPYEDEIF